MKPVALPVKASEVVALFCSPRPDVHPKPEAVVPPSVRPLKSVVRMVAGVSVVGMAAGTGTES